MENWCDSLMVKLKVYWIWNWYEDHKAWRLDLIRRLYEICINIFLSCVCPFQYVEKGFNKLKDLASCSFGMDVLNLLNCYSIN